MRVDINTRMVALFGTPLGQSFAARMQNTAYEAMGENMLYFYCEVDNEHLPDVIKAVRYMNFAGCAVTKPNKVEVLKYLDELDDLCAKMGASNTVVKLPDGRLKGYNTDGLGAYRSFVEAGVKAEETTFFCFGAGGSGRAVSSTVAFHGAKKIYVADVVHESARSLVEDINTKIAPIAELVDCSDAESVRAHVALSDVVMNNSGLGMRGHEDETPIDKSALSPRQLCFDATYNPAQTRFLREASEVGCRTLNGVGMNIYQGAAQIELWTGREAPIDRMREEFDLMLKEAAQR